jgi:hypothetical protein
MKLKGKPSSFVSMSDEHHPQAQAVREQIAEGRMRLHAPKLWKSDSIVARLSRGRASVAVVVASGPVSEDGEDRVGHIIPPPETLRAPGARVGALPYAVIDNGAGERIVYLSSRAVPEIHVRRRKQTPAAGFVNVRRRERRAERDVIQPAPPASFQQAAERTDESESPRADDRRGPTPSTRASAAIVKRPLTTIERPLPGREEPVRCGLATSSREDDKIRRPARAAYRASRDTARHAHTGVGRPPGHGHRSLLPEERRVGEQRPEMVRTAQRPRDVVSDQTRAAARRGTAAFRAVTSPGR